MLKYKQVYSFIQFFGLLCVYLIKTNRRRWILWADARCLPFSSILRPFGWFCRLVMSAPVLRSVRIPSQPIYRYSLDICKRCSCLHSLPYLVAEHVEITVRQGGIARNGYYAANIFLLKKFFDWSQYGIKRRYICLAQNR